MAIAALVITAHLRLDPRWHGRAGLLLTVAIAGAVALVVLGAAGHKHAPGGLYERIFLGLELLWIALSAARIAVTRSPGRPARMLSAEAGIPHVR